MKRFHVAHGVVLLLVLLLAACGGDDGAADPAAPQADALTPAELEHGIGPVQRVELGPVDAALAERGEQSFTTKCAACHKLAERYVGPPLGDILARRSPEFIMNMMLNPDEMVKRHPEAKDMLATYLTPMPNQNLTEAEARAILEYLRQEHPPSTTQRQPL